MVVGFFYQLIELPGFLSIRPLRQIGIEHHIENIGYGMAAGPEVHTMHRVVNEAVVAEALDTQQPVGCHRCGCNLSRGNRVSSPQGLGADICDGYGVFVTLAPHTGSVGARMGWKTIVLGKVVTICSSHPNDSLQVVEKLVEVFNESPGYGIPCVLHELQPQIGAPFGGGPARLRHSNQQQRTFIHGCIAKQRLHTVNVQAVMVLVRTGVPVQQQRDHGFRIAFLGFDLVGLHLGVVWRDTGPKRFSIHDPQKSLGQSMLLQATKPLRRLEIIYPLLFQFCDTPFHVDDICFYLRRARRLQVLQAGQEISLAMAARMPGST